ncbi:MAG: hypothetical protein RMX96_35040 [Nostoc sp. ChiSLP02]|nr:hypothetical protein [Nostoc sp. DedSLP05]MDZ8101648.1 hypothetical protein [Nostoc sp. DedSLP01]MDZ8190039.1 hypothetical protein [Nostoc sp. ChiSLP02]
MNSLRKVVADKYGLEAFAMYDEFFKVHLPENQDHTLKFLESNLPECIRIEKSRMFRWRCNCCVGSSFIFTS